MYGTSTFTISPRPALIFNISTFFLNRNEEEKARRKKEGGGKREEEERQQGRERERGEGKKEVGR